MGYKDVIDVCNRSMVDRTIAPAAMKWIIMHFSGINKNNTVEDENEFYNKSYALNQAIRILQENSSDYLYEVLIPQLNVYEINKLLKYSNYLKNNELFKKYAFIKLLGVEENEK